MKILLAVDGSEFTIKAALFLITHLQWLKEPPELHLLHIKAQIPAGLAAARARAILGDVAIDSYYQEESAAALAPAEKILRENNIAFQSSYKVGEAAHEIQHYAEEQLMDLIVMGSHGHGALVSVVMGSVTTKVLALTNIPVLIVR